MDDPDYTAQQMPLDIGDHSTRGDTGMDPVGWPERSRAVNRAESIHSLEPH
jgi:hypothetical protein